MHFSSVTASTTEAGSKIGDGYTTQAPWVHVAKFPNTRRVYEKIYYQFIGATWTEEWYGLIKAVEKWGRVA